MVRINKSVGLSPSERFLGRLADHSFLSLWSYPNVFRDKAKELCDLLVVCGRHIIVFSDKSIEYPENVSDDLAWSRWYRRAIGKSADQLKRAISWIKNHPDRLFLDAQCSERFPIDLPPTSEMILHGIVVARGAAKACMKHFGSGSGSLGLLPLESRTRKSSEVPPVPFFVGNPCPEEDGVYHILDDVTLQILLTELDTVVDLSDYLAKKERLIRGDHLMAAHGEEDLLAVYMKNLNENGEHDFTTEPGRAIAGHEMLVVEGGSYNDIRKRGEYKRKKSADRQSYLWDKLIESFARNIIADKTYLVRGFEGYHEPSKREMGLRYMALVPRLERRSHSIAIKDAFQKIGTRDRFFRAMLPGESHPDRSTGFFLLLVKRDTVFVDKSDEDYRKLRANLGIGYALNLLRHVPYLDRVVGIATEDELSRELRSEDLLYAERPDWTEEGLAEIDAMAEGMGIFTSGPPVERKATRIRPLEYPPSHHSATGGFAAPYYYSPESAGGSNRNQRRALRAKARRKR